MLGTWQPGPGESCGDSLPCQLRWNWTQGRQPGGLELCQGQGCPCWPGPGWLVPIHRREPACTATEDTPPWLEPEELSKLWLPCCARLASCCPVLSSRMSSHWEALPRAIRHRSIIWGWKTRSEQTPAYLLLLICGCVESHVVLVSVPLKQEVPPPCPPFACHMAANSLAS